MSLHVERMALVAPGEVLAEGAFFAGENTYRDGNKIVASRVGLADAVGNKVMVVPFKGCYIPRVDDFVVGRVVDTGMSGWSVDIDAPYPAMLPASETMGSSRFPRERKDLSKIFNVGDLVMATVIAFDRTRDPLLSARDRGLGKVISGRVLRIMPAKIPRIIGKKGSMITMLKMETQCQIIVGQNGVVLVSGRSPENERVAVEALYMIEREAHTRGLTDRVKVMIAKELGGKI